MRSIWIVLAVVSLVMGGCSQPANPMTFTGSVEAQEIDVSPEISGTIVSLGVREGDSVQKGQTLLTLDTADYTIKLQMAQTALGIVKQKSSDLADGNSKNQIRQAKANVEVIQEQLNSSQEELIFLKKELTRIQSLHSEGVATEQQLDAALRSLDREQAKYQGLIKQKDAAIAAVSLIEEGATKQVLSAAQMEVQLKELEIRDLERTIMKGVLTCPMDGVVQTVNFEPGERIAPGQRAVTLIDTSKPYVKIYVPEKLLHRIKNGMNVEFEDSFLKGKKIKGVVTYISNRAEFTPKNSESKENKQEMVYEVKIDIDDSEGIVKPGMFIDVTLKEGIS